MGGTGASPDLDALLETAAASQRPADFDALFEALKGRELFLNVVHLEDGSPRMRVALIEGDLRALALFHNRRHRLVQAPFAGLLWEDALEMLGKTPDVEALLLHSDGDSWIAIDKAEAAELLARSAGAL